MPPAAASQDASDLRRQMLRTNEEQTAFYETEAAERGNVVTKVWRGLRQRQLRIRRRIGIADEVYALHREWLGDLSDKKVLDLGCFDGNPLSLEIASEAREYLGIDLSRPAIERLREKLREAGLEHARAEALDFLSEDFEERDFDVVYAHSVVHHFEHLDVLLEGLATIMAPGGIVISIDPLNTSLPVRVARRLYAPFQSDSAWEWPFTRETVLRIGEAFDLVEVRGFLGHAKWALPFAVAGDDVAVRVGKALHRRDREAADKVGRGLWRCMQVTMCWRRR